MGAEVMVVKSPADHRTYKALELPNGLRAILIHDPEINPGASLDPAPAHVVKHGEIVDDDASMSIGDEDSSGSEEGSDDEYDNSEGSSGEEEEEEGEEEDEEHEHVRQHHPRELHGDGGVKKAAAALSVGIGYYSDPLHLQGLSHYLEHMLFMGSEKYPDENDYDAFLSSNSGASNACTEEEATTYHFDCAPAALEGALDRFAQFFVAPLVKADALEREVLAVDNEFSGVLQSDGCRQMQLRSHFARKEHPAHKFGWGNRKSLVEDPAAAGHDVRAELLKHYKAQYSAERMNLVVLGGERMETLEKWVTEKFAAVPAGKGPRPRYGTCGFPFATDNTSEAAAAGPQFSILPAVRDEHRLSALFQLPCLEGEYTKKAEEYLSHLIGHEGKGSLLAALKSRGWATELCAGVQDQTSAAYLFEISITLTDAGLAAGRGCGLAAAEVLFQYLDMLRAVEPQKWAWEEMATISEMKWRFLEEEDAAEYVAQVASDMHQYKLEHTLIGSYLHEVFDPELISSLLARMTPGDVRLDLQTKNFDECKGQLQALAPAELLTTGVEPWFNFPYVSSRLPLEVVEEWTAAGECPKDLSLPPPNPYLATDFTLLSEKLNTQNSGADGAVAIENGRKEEKESDNGTPIALSNNINPAFPTPPVVVTDIPGLRMWHKLDETFKVPRANAYFRLALPAAYASPHAAALTHLVVKLLEDALCQEAYLADVADLRYYIWFEGAAGIDIKVDGYSQKLPLLSSYIFQTLAGLQFTDEDCTRVHESLLRGYRNANMKPLKHANYLRLTALRAQIWPIEAIRAQLETATAADVRSFLPSLLNDAHIESLLHGNASEEDARALGEAARASLGATGTALHQDRTLNLPGPRSFLLLRASVINPEEDNSAIEAYYQCGPAADPRGRALLDFIDQLVYEPCYDTLRTKEQLGYTVSSGTRMTHGISGLCVIVQSGVHGPVYLDGRVDAFLESFVERLSAMESAEFEKNRESLLANKLMKDRNLGEEAEKAWDAVVNRGQQFNWKQEEVEAIKEVTQAEIVEFFKEMFAPGGGQRRKLAVYVAGKVHSKDLEEAAVPDGAVEVKDVEELKKKYGFYPAVVATGQGK